MGSRSVGGGIFGRTGLVLDRVSLAVGAAARFTVPLLGAFLAPAALLLLVALLELIRVLAHS